MSKKILMIVAPRDYRDEEFNEPKEVFEQKGYEVVVASKGINEAIGSQGGKTKVHKDISEAEVDNYDALVFIGGSGSSIFFNDETAHKIVREANSKKKVIGAICITPSILANAGILSGKNVTSFSSERTKLESKNAVFTNEGVTVDGNLVTANGPGSAKEFGEKISNLLGK